eukprot:3298208-Rhodomonas_salina.4
MPSVNGCREQRCSNDARTMMCSAGRGVEGRMPHRFEGREEGRPSGCDDLGRKIAAESRTRAH